MAARPATLPAPPDNANARHRTPRKSTRTDLRKAGPLGNNANNYPTAGQRHDPQADPRIERWEARAVQWNESSLPRCRKCGRVTVAPSGLVGVRANGVAVGYAGLSTCASVWACPVCNSKIQAVRRVEIGTTVATVLGHGGTVLLATMTLRHTRALRLDPLWRSLRYCWQAATARGTVARRLAALGSLGYVATTEVTYGGSGWHPHLHVLLCFPDRLAPAAVDALRQALVGAWCRAAERDGLDALEHVQDLRRVTAATMSDALGDYLSKSTYDAAGAAWEMTSTQTKTSTRATGSVTPWQLLKRVHRDGDADALDLWHEWESASHGKRSLTWGRGLRAWVGLHAEATDDEVAAAVVGTADETGLVITDWSCIVRRPSIGARLLGLVGPGGDWSAGAAYLREVGVPFERVRGAV